MADKRIGQYTYSDRHELGRGTFAKVYLAKKDGQNGEVAIKIFSKAARESFLREVDVYQYIGNLNHHILHFEDKGEEDAEPYIVFQQAQEETLRDQIKQMSGKPFGTERALAILRQVGSAIIAVHDESINVIHGDIRPENILFDRNNQALLADFGMAVRLSSKEEKVCKSSSPADPLYMAPERFRVDGLLTKESDQYSLGCIAYELLAGRHPLGPIASEQAKSIEYIERKINTTKYDNPCEYNELLQDFLGKAIIKAIARNSEGRYGSVKEFIDALVEIPAVIGYGQRYPTQPPVLRDLEMPQKGHFKHLTNFLADSDNGYISKPKTDRVGRHKFTYTRVETSADSSPREARNLLYVPVEFIINSDEDYLEKIYVIINQLLRMGDPILIFYDSVEAPSLEITEICDSLCTSQADTWFMPRKYIDNFGIDKNAQKEWIEGIWEMTRVKRNNSSA